MSPFQSRRHCPTECLQLYSGPVIIAVPATSHLPWRFLGINSLSLPPGLVPLLAAGPGSRPVLLALKVSLPQPSPPPPAESDPRPHNGCQGSASTWPHSSPSTPPTHTHSPIPLASPGSQQSPAAKSDPKPRWQEPEVATGRGSVRWRAGQAQGSLQDTLKLGRSGSNSSARRV